MKSTDIIGKIADLISEEVKLQPEINYILHTIKGLIEQHTAILIDQDGNERGVYVGIRITERIRDRTSLKASFIDSTSCIVIANRTWDQIASLVKCLIREATHNAAMHLCQEEGKHFMNSTNQATPKPRICHFCIHRIEYPICCRDRSCFQSTYCHDHPVQYIKQKPMLYTDASILRSNSYVAPSE